MFDFDDSMLSNNLEGRDYSTRNSTQRKPVQKGKPQPLTIFNETDLGKQTKASKKPQGTEQKSHRHEKTPHDDRLAFTTGRHNDNHHARNNNSSRSNEKHNVKFKNTNNNNKNKYYSKNNNYNSNNNNKKKDWINNWNAADVGNSYVDKRELVTHVNQTNDLADMSDDLKNLCKKYRTMEDWMRIHSLSYLKLDMKHLLSLAKFKRPKMSKTTGKLQQCMEFQRSDVDSFHSRLQAAIEEYSVKIKEYFKGTKRYFGDVRGDRVAVVLDCSEDNFVHNRRMLYISALKRIICIAPFLTASSFPTATTATATTTAACAATVATYKATSIATDTTAKQLVQEQLSNRRSLFLAAYNSRYYKLWSSPEFISQTKPECGLQMICDYVERRLLSLNVCVHFVSFECYDEATNELMRRFASDTGGVYHCFNKRFEQKLNYTSSELELLLKEVKKCQQVLLSIYNIRTGMLGTAIVKIIEEISQELSQYPFNQSLPSNHFQPLQLEPITFKQDTSHDWLLRNGLKAKNLDIYQVLSRNAFSYRQQFVHVTGKTVQSLVNERAMVQFHWSDGSIKNVHVNFLELQKYQGQLGEMVGLLEKRVEWLEKGSRRLFGSVTEEKCSLEIKMWRKTLVEPNGDQLQLAWKWIQSLKCSGSRNTLSGVMMVIENDEMTKFPLGLYLMTTGAPDQSRDLVTSYLEEHCLDGDVKLHVIYTSVDDYEPAIKRLDLSPYPNTGGYRAITNGTPILNDVMIFDPNSPLVPPANLTDFYDNLRFTDQLNQIAFNKHANLIADQETGSERPRYMSRNVSYINPSIAPLDTLFTIIIVVILTLQLKQNSNQSDIIESDDVTLLRDEMEKAKEHSRKCTQLVEAVRSKNRLLHEENRSLLSLKQTILSAARQNHINEKEKIKRRVTKNLAYMGGSKFRPSSAPQESYGRVRGENNPSDYDEKDTNVYRHILLKNDQLIIIENEVKVLIKKYLLRLKWLYTGSRRYFGQILEDSCIIIIDTSGSMVDHVTEVKSALKLLLDEQIAHVCKLFNILTFSNEVRAWKLRMTGVNEETLRQAREWVDENLNAHGNTCTLHALQIAFKMSEASSIYLLTDGRPDTTMSLIGQEVGQMNINKGSNNRVKVNTISFNCNDEQANSFLKKLAHENGGRYMRLSPGRNVSLLLDTMVTRGFSDYQLSTLGAEEGDDVEEVCKEVSKLSTILNDIHNYKQLNNEWNMT
ncbi:hypothetical protein HELRODRAFT_169786 [Helobdella robusta]|uniref:VWFA domain-containing protein n=1 Tax=Helobdella robusta TaxID=6412 RepID=T1F2B6_HELRO|nr:hypothetical protein HELRODRAFT_169786 [Helobdella robusta]ESO08063.1 hypothetical protein HELRODRAFT_169786 [Helobdella robusta]